MVLSQHLSCDELRGMLAQPRLMAPSTIEVYSDSSRLISQTVSRISAEDKLNFELS